MCRAVGCREVCSPLGPPFLAWSRPAPPLLPCAVWGPCLSIPSATGISSLIWPLGGSEQASPCLPGLLQSIVSSRLSGARAVPTHRPIKDSSGGGVEAGGGAGAGGYQPPSTHTLRAGSVSVHRAPTLSQALCWALGIPELWGTVQS